MGGLVLEEKKDEWRVKSEFSKWKVAQSFVREGQGVEGRGGVSEFKVDRAKKRAWGTSTVQSVQYRVYRVYRVRYSSPTGGKEIDDGGWDGDGAKLRTEVN